MRPAPLDRLPGRFRTGRSGWPKTQFWSTMGSFCMTGIKFHPTSHKHTPPTPTHPKNSRSIRLRLHFSELHTMPQSKRNAQTQQYVSCRSGRATEAPWSMMEHAICHAVIMQRSYHRHQPLLTSWYQGALIFRHCAALAFAFSFSSSLDLLRSEM
jgi:hypothetical protein